MAEKKTKKKTAPKKPAKKAIAPKKSAKKTEKKPLSKAVKKEKPKTKKTTAKKPTTKTKKKSPVSQEKPYESVRKELLKKRQQLVAEAKNEIKNYLTGENRQVVETALDEGDWSVVDLSEDISLRKLTTHRESLLRIDEALRKIDEGTYGICEDCGEEISPERLKILPYATLCRDCQEKHEMIEAAEKATE